MSDLVTQFTRHAALTFNSGTPTDFQRSIPVDASHPFWGPLGQALSVAPIDENVVSSIVASVQFAHDASREGLVSLLVAVLNNIREQGQGGPYGDFSRLLAVYTCANRLFALSPPSTSSSSTSYLHPNLSILILHLARTLAQISENAALISPHPPRHPQSARSIRDSTRQVIEKSSQVALASVSEGEWSAGVSKAVGAVVGDIAWGLGNVLFRIYAQRKLHTQATELSKSFSSLAPHEDKRIASRGGCIRQTDVCPSYYWRGRLGVVLLDMRGAKFWLDKAWSVCPQSAVRQRRAILIRLIPVNLLLGRLPSSDLLQTYNLPQFIPLLRAFQSGNVPEWRRILDDQREWFRSRSIWLILMERGEILVWRNLLRKSLKFYYLANPDAPRNRCPTNVFVNAVRAAFKGSGEAEDGTIVLEDLICVIASLIDQSLILGHLSYSQQQLVMKPSDDGMGGFPRLSQVVPRRVEANV